MLLSVRTGYEKAGACAPHTIDLSSVRDWPAGYMDKLGDDAAHRRKILDLHAIRINRPGPAHIVYGISWGRWSVSVATDSFALSTHLLTLSHRAQDRSYPQKFVECTYSRHSSSRHPIQSRSHYSRLCTVTNPISLLSSSRPSPKQILLRAQILEDMRLTRQGYQVSHAQEALAFRISSWQRRTRKRMATKANYIRDDTPKTRLSSMRSEPGAFPPCPDLFNQVLKRQYIQEHQDCGVCD